MDNFLTQGTKPGAMHGKEETRALLLWLAARTAMPLTVTAAEESLLNEEIANWFELRDALSYLLKHGILHSEEYNGDLVLTVPETSLHLLAEQESRLSRQSCARALLAADRFLERESAECAAMTSILAQPDGSCLVTFRQGTDTQTLLRVTVWCADRAQAESAVDAFSKNPAKLFGAVLENLSGAN